ncbi:MAG: diadenylate cyclase CdaA [Gemmatales bacterium]|nr:diadenylate cyclase CdaA [Gemmatales bacterium]MDW8386520.1 diadenylate cyclase CdaA [Gemmatales bacterium]
MPERLIHLYESVGFRDLIEVGILAVFIYLVLRLIGAARGAGIVRGLGIVVVGVFLLAQVVIASLDLTELSKILDYVLSTALVGLIVIFQPELRRGLLVLGRYPVLRAFNPTQGPLADKLADAAEALSREYTGALIAIQRSMSLAAYINSGERLDAEVTVDLLRTIFHKASPLHDGAVIIADGRLAAAACQLPLGEAPEGAAQYGMRHRAALGLSEETDAVVLVVSEETGRISLAIGGRLEPVARENLSRRLAAELQGSLRLAA